MEEEITLEENIEPDISEINEIEREDSIKQISINCEFEKTNLLKRIKRLEIMNFIIIGTLVIILVLSSINF